MNAVLLEAGPLESCAPVTCTCPLADVPVANRPLAELQQQRLDTAGFTRSDTRADEALFVRQDAWLSDSLLSTLSQARSPVAVRDEEGSLLAWTGDSAQKVLTTRTLEADKESFLIRYPWHLLAVQEQVMAGIHESRVEGEISPGATLEGILILGKGSRILPGVYLEGTVMIGTGCKIGPNCYLRGATAIGDHCHIGQAVEVKNSIIMEHTSIGHLSYCGDSVVGRRVNFGAGTITANYRHDGKNHRSLVAGKYLDTGRRKFGAILGDDVHTGIHTSIYPGRKLWPGVSTLPGTIVKHDLPERQPG